MKLHKDKYTLSRKARTPEGYKMRCALWVCIFNHNELDS